MSAFPRTAEALAAAETNGDTFTYLFFWSYKTSRHGAIGPECLSQWWPCEFTVDSHRFASAEHYMMWRKATLFGDHATAEKILAGAHPGAAKALGRIVRGFDPQIWQRERVDIVCRGNHAKFSQDPRLQRFLLSTRDRVLVEASRHDDRIWGIGIAADNPRATAARTWRGANLLGFALMDIRTQLAPSHPLRPTTADPKLQSRS